MNKKLYSIAWSAALVVLLGALWFFNFYQPANAGTRAPEAASAANTATPTAASAANAAEADATARPEATAAAPARADKQNSAPARRPAAVETAAVTAEPDPTSEPETGIEYGCAVGQRLPDFELPTVGGGEFRLSEHRGGAVVLNLWATWCTPCVNELPHFDKLQREHAGEVTVLAIHSDLITDDVEAYLAGFDYGMAFAVDESGDVISSVGGTTMLPQTIVLNGDGVVTYNKVGSVTYEMLEELLSEAGGEAAQ